MKIKFKGVSRSEGRFIVVTLLLIGVFSYFNFQKSYVRARDVARKNDLKHIATALNNYFYDFNQFPPSKDGKMLACGQDENPVECRWGLDGILDYISSLPRDPQSGRNYVYISDTRNFQIFASLESRQDAEYNIKVASRNIKCGKSICNFGVVSSGKADDELQPASDIPVNVKK